MCCQERKRQGRMRSAASQRPTVVVETQASGQAAATRRASSARLQRESGTAWVRGRLQAVAVTWARTSGGKTPRCAWPRSIVERLGFGPATAPFAHEPIGGPDVPTNLLIT